MNDFLEAKKVALVHDYLLRLGGAERVFKVLHDMFPEAPIYTVVYDENFVRDFLPGVFVRASFLQKLPRFLHKRYKYFSFLIPVAVENMDLSDFDLVISSCSAFCKGVITRPDAIHICYCHTPTRFLWDWTHPYIKTLEKKGICGFLAKIELHFLRFWDRQAAQRVDYFIANSKHVAERIKKYYRRDAKVIYPPVEIPNSKFPSYGRSPVGRQILNSNYFLIVSQLRSYKQIDIAIEAFRKLGFPLKIIGDGDEKKRLMKIAQGAGNIQFLGFLPDEEVLEYYRSCKALIFPGEEDFGIVMTEAMLCGKPVLALRRGGATEIVKEGVSGEFFDDIHPVLLADGVRRLMENYHGYSPASIRESALSFSRSKFGKELLDFVKNCAKL